MTQLLSVPLAAAMLLALPPASQAADRFSVPEGCEAFLTVQMKGCQVSLMWRCDVAPAGDLWDALFTMDGLQTIVNYDRQFQWIDATYMWDGSHESLIMPSADPISMDDLLEQGVDTFSFSLRRTDSENTRLQRVIGADQLTGEEVEIDGVPLLVAQTEFQILTEDGAVDYHARGRQYVSSEMRVFFLGQDVVIEDGVETEYDNAPVDFIFPGEPGFGETRPLYECDSKKSSLTDDLLEGRTNAG